MALALLTLAFAIAAADRAEGTKRQHIWPMQKGFGTRNGTSPYVMPDISKGPAWSWQGPHLDVFRAGPAMDDEMNIYVTAVSGRTYKFSPEGKQLWEHFTGPARQGVSGVPSMGEDFLVMLTRNGYLISLDLETGAERWDRKVAPMTGLSCDSILIEGNLAIIAVADPVPPLVALGVHMQVSVENNVVLGIDLTAGEEKWRFFPAMECYNFQAATIGDGSFIFTDKTGAPYRVTLSGEKIWYTGVTDRNSATTGAAVIYEGKVYTVSNEGGSHQTAVEGQGLLSMYDYETGALLWKVKLGLPGMQAAAAGQIAGVPGPSLVIGIGKNPGAPLLVRASMVLPHILTLLLGLPAHLLSLYFPHLFAWKQERSIAAFNAQTGALKWWYRLEPWQQLSCAGDSEKFLDRYKAMESGENPTNEPMCMPDANAQPVIDAAGTAFVPFQDGSIYAVRDENGDGQISPEEIKARRVGDAFQSSPAMGPGMMAVVDCGGRLEVFK